MYIKIYNIANRYKFYNKSSVFLWKKLKKISSIFIFIVAILFSVAIFTFLLVLFIKNYHVPKDIYSSSDMLSILSLNVGILQTLVALITLGMGAIAFINFFNINKEFKKFKRSVKKQVKNIRKNSNTEANIKEITAETKAIEQNKEWEEVKDVF